MADEKSMEQVAKIVKANPARRYIVVSAPGKTKDCQKVTDVLIECYGEIQRTGTCNETFPEIIRRYRLLNCGISSERFNNLMSDIKLQMEKSRNYDFAFPEGNIYPLIFC